MTSKSWYGLCKDPLLWQRLCEREGWTTSRPPATQNPTHLSAPFASPSRIHSAPDWYDVYKQRSRLMDNWRAGRFANFQLPRPDRGHEGHAGDVYTIQLHGKHLLSGGLDGTIRVWNLDTCRLVGSPLRGHQDGVLCLQFDPRKHEDTIISGSGNGELIFWQFSTRAIVKLVSQAHSGAVVGLKFDDRFLITSSQDATIKIWDRKTLRARTLVGHRGSVNAIDFSADILVSASGDRTVKIWSISQGVCVKTVEEPRAVACVRIGGEMIFCGGKDKSLGIYNSFSGSQRERLLGHGDVVRAIRAQLIQDRVVIASGSYDGSVIVWMRAAEGPWYHCRLARSHVPSRYVGDRGRDQFHRTSCSIPVPAPGPLPTCTVIGEVGGEAIDGNSLRPSTGPWIFGVDLDDRRVVCCSESSKIVGWDFANEDPGIIACGLGLIQSEKYSSTDHV